MRRRRGRHRRKHAPVVNVLDSALITQHLERGVDETEDLGVPQRTHIVQDDAVGCKVNEAVVA